MKTYVLERQQLIERPRNETFAFFSDAFNLERITPPFLRFRILNRPPVVMGAGTLLEYRLAIMGISFYWQTLIEEWLPDESFVDIQLKGPYALWRHTHSFEAIDPHSTLMRDRVEYRVPFGVFGRVANRLFVAAMLKKIFDHREKMTAQLLAVRAEKIETRQQ